MNNRSIKLFAIRKPSSLGAFDVCDLIPTEYLPVLKDITRTASCTPAGKAAMATLIADAMGAKAGQQMDPWMAVATTVGPEVITQCLCKQRSASGISPESTSVAWYANPWVIGGIALAVLGLGFFVYIMKK